VLVTKRGEWIAQDVAEYHVLEHGFGCLVTKRGEWSAQDVAEYRVFLNTVLGVWLPRGESEVLKTWPNIVCS
jgi:hypothetical protein